MRRRLFLASPIALLATGVLAVDDEYPRVVAGRAIRFPRDAGAHTAFRSEWWYITGWVQDASAASRGAIRRAALARCEIAFFCAGLQRPRVRPPGGSDAGSKIGS